MVGGLTETKGEILAALAEVGSSLSDSQLARLHRAGAISPPTLRSLGRGRGRQSLYPPGTTVQVIRLAQLASRERRLPERAWLCWWLYGGAISDAAACFLRATAADLQSMVEKVRALARGESVETDGKSWTLDDMYRAAEEERLDGVLGKARARTGKRRFSSVMAFLVQVAAGEFRAFPEDSLAGSSEPEQQLIEFALGLTRGRSEELGDVEPWLQGDLEADFARLAAQVKTMSFDQEAAEPDHLLNIARVEVKALAEVVATAADGFDAIFGRGAFSYRAMAEALTLDDYRAQVFAVLAWSKMRRDRELREGMTEVVAHRGQVEIMRQAIQTIAALRERVPVLAEALAPARLADAFRDAEAGRAFEGELARLREAHAAEVAQTLAELSDGAATGATERAKRAG